MINRFPVRKLLGEHAPGTAGTPNIEDSIDHRFQIDFKGTTTRLIRLELSEVVVPIAPR